jgi:2-dehydropantoate 2-reductase
LTSGHFSRGLAASSDSFVLCCFIVVRRKTAGGSAEMQHLKGALKAGQSGLNVCVIGAGAIGCLLATRLAQKQQSVTLLGRSGKTVSGQKVRLRELDGTISEVRVGFAGNPAALSDVYDGTRPFDYFFITVKHGDTYGVRDAFSEISERGLFGAQSSIVSLQNGMGNVEILKSGTYPFNGQERVCQGVTYQGASILEPFFVSHNGKGKTFLQANQEMAPIADLLSGDESEAFQLTEEVETMVYTKLLANAVINPLTVMTGGQNGIVLDPKFHDLVESAAREFEQIMDRKGVSLQLGVCSSASVLMEDTRSRVSQ